MGRFGHRLFDHDQALMSAVELCKEIAQDSKHELAHLLCQTLSSAAPAVAGFYIKEYDAIVNLAAPDMEAAYNERLRWKLEAGLGEELFKTYRAKVTSETSANKVVSDDMVKVRVIILAAFMMRYGAKMKQDDLKFVRELLPTIASHETFQLPVTDHGFRGPGKRQFQAALDHYQPQQPRDFSLPSCHACGKWDMDIAGKGKSLMMCGGCKNPISAAWFCDKDCQKRFWKIHKQGNCGQPRGKGVGVWQVKHKDGASAICAFEGALV